MRSILFRDLKTKIVSEIYGDVDIAKYNAMPHKYDKVAHVDVDERAIKLEEWKKNNPINQDQPHVDTEDEKKKAVSLSEADIPSKTKSKNRQ